MTHTRSVHHDRTTDSCPECGSVALETEGDVVRCIDCGAFWEL
jgi:uncharacterized Zn finger protein (UPF0148 family)